MRIAYLDCFSGISGDMTLAALIDAGADPTWIEEELRKLPVAFLLEWKKVVKKGVSALRLEVHDLEQKHDHSHHDHDHNHQDHHHDHRHHHHNHHDHHDHHHDHHHHQDHAHTHRRYQEIVEMITEANLPVRATGRALAIFQEIAAAEAKIHGIPVESVHFHEVGAVDSIVDIVGVALALENLGIDFLYCGPIPTGNGFVRCDHGLYPVPAPATMEILKGIPLRSTTIQRELTTPTGAGIAKALASQFGPLPDITVEAIGYGAGKRDLADQPNVLRILIGTTRS